MSGKRPHNAQSTADNNGAVSDSHTPAQAVLDVELPETGDDPQFSDYAAIPSGTPLILDHGSYRVRAGWASDPAPRLSLPPLMAKSRTKKDERQEYVGSDVLEMYQDKPVGKSSMEGGVVVQWDVEQMVLDHTFSRLGIDADSVDHPIVMSEHVCNPAIARAYMSELLFEGYRVPQVAYGIDALFSHAFNRGIEHARDGTALIVSAGHHASYVTPLISGRIDAENSKRVSVGSEAVQQYARKLLHLRYPALAADLSPFVIQSLVHGHCAIPPSYGDYLRWLSQPTHMAAEARHFQLHVDLSLIPTRAELEARRARRHDMRIRMTKMQMTQMKKRLKEYTSQHTLLKKLHQNSEDMDDEEAKDHLSENGFASMRALVHVLIDVERKLKRLGKSITRSERKLTILVTRGAKLAEPEDDEEFDDDDVDDDDDDDEEEDEEEEGEGVRLLEALEEDEEEKYPLLRRDVSTLTDDEKSAYKRQKFLKTMADARLKAASERKAIREEKERARLLLEEEISRDKPAWLAKMAAERAVLENDLIRCKRRKEELSDRRSGLSRARMRLLVQQAGSNEAQNEDTFGMNDDDWNVYKKINRSGDDEEQALEERIKAIDNLVKKYNPAEKRIETRETMLEDLRQSRQMRMAVERFQIPELLFQPSIGGIDEGGITDMLGFIFPRYSADIQQSLATNVFLTGGCVHIPGFSDRIRAHLRSIRPHNEQIKIYVAQDPMLDAWKGARLFAADAASLQRNSISRAAYEEHGPYHLQEHFASNAQPEWETSS